NGDLPVAALVHQLQHHRVWFAVDVFLTGPMKVELDQLILRVAHRQEIAGTSGRVVDPDSDSVVVDRERTAPVVEAQRGQARLLRIADIDRRLLLAVAGSVLRCKSTPMIGADGALVTPFRFPFTAVGDLRARGRG